MDEEKLKDEYTNQHLPIIKSDLENALDNNFQLVDLFYFLGGFMACEQFNTDLKITDHIPPKLNEFFPDAKYLYKDLKNSLNFEDAARNFHYFSSMMEEFL